ncbi:MAG: O-antigen ligase domain-containing protein [Nitrospiraceae bacterium]|nr:O-antigen ligase domain-containing protein [Nitrospiraceae bacterium]
MNNLVPAALFGWIPVILALFAFLPNRRAVVVGFVMAWLFLPDYGYEIRFLPEYDKTSATCFGIFLGTLIFDTDRIFKFRPRWSDLPVVVLSFCPIISSRVNGLGLYDGFSESINECVRWLLPYFIGRLYFTDLRSMRELVIGIFLGGLVYVPLCLWEIRMSPQLHRQVYGFARTAFIQTYRYGGYRPIVFIGGSGLSLGLWMAFASLCGFGLWQWRTLREILRVPTYVLFPLIIVTTVLGKATAAILLMFMGIGCLVSMRVLRNNLPLLALALVPLCFIGARVSGQWDGYALVDIAEPVFGAERAQSLEWRFWNENMLLERAWEQPLFGWGGWGRSRVRDESGRDISVTDSLWIIKFGKNGFLGLAALVATVIVPVILLRWRLPTRLWGNPLAGPTIIVSVLLCLGLINNALNGALIPLSVVMAGGLSGFRKTTEEEILPAMVAAQATGGPELSPAQRLQKRRAVAKGGQ